MAAVRDNVAGPVGAQGATRGDAAEDPLPRLHPDLAPQGAPPRDAPAQHHSTGGGEPMQLSPAAAAKRCAADDFQLPDWRKKFEARAPARSTQREKQPYIRTAPTPQSRSLRGGTAHSVTLAAPTSAGDRSGRSETAGAARLL